MPLLRAFLLWALMVAVPFQGYAAASMLQCKPGAQLTVMQVAGGAHAAEHQGHDAHDAQASTAQGQGAHEHADPLHKCSTCGACHAVALITEPTWRASVLPPADLADSLHPVLTRAPRVLDRPPRA